MSAIARFEQFFERAIEGAVHRVFRPPLHPVEIARRVERAMDDAARPGVRGQLAPNDFVVRLNAEDWAAYADFESQLGADLRSFVQDLADERGYRFVGPVHVRLEGDPATPRSNVRVLAGFSEPPPEVTMAKQPKLEAPTVGTPTSRSDGTAALAGDTVRLSIPAQTSPASAPQSPSAVLVFRVDAPRGPLERRFVVQPPSVSIGRALDNDLVLDDARVSRRHAIIKSNGAEYVVEDLSSTNGTFLNGRRIRRRVLREGDALSLGGVLLRFRFGRTR